MSVHYRQLLKAVGSDDKSLPKKALFSFRHLKRAVKPLVKILQTSTSSDEQWQAAMHAFGQCNK